MRLPTASLEHLRVAAHVQTAVAAAHDLDAGGSGLDRVRLDGRGDDLVDGDLALVGELVRGLQAREVHDARGELREARGLGGEATGEVAHLIGVVGGGFDRLGEQADRADRRLQLVTRVGHEVAAHLLDPLALGDVAQHEQREPRRDARSRARRPGAARRAGRRGAAAASP